MSQQSVIAVTALPVLARWMVLALGSTGSERLRPMDPVARWLLRERPGLRPSMPAPSLTASLRARTRLVDQLLLEELRRLSRSGPISLWTLGAGFDARWWRLGRSMRELDVRPHEVDTAEMLGTKQHLLRGSRYAEAYAQVRRAPSGEQDWRVRVEPGRSALVLVESLAGRWNGDRLMGLLMGIREEHPDASVIACVPCKPARRTRWSTAALRQPGWQVAADVYVAARDRLVSRAGHELAMGLYPYRVVVLRPG